MAVNAVSSEQLAFVVFIDQNVLVGVFNAVDSLSLMRKGLKNK